MISPFAVTRALQRLITAIIDAHRAQTERHVQRKSEPNAPPVKAMLAIMLASI
jgi:hypothetical protein